MDYGNGLSEEMARYFRLEKKNRNNVIREKINIENSVLDDTRYNWYDHVQRMDQERLPRRILE